MPEFLFMALKYRLTRSNASSRRAVGAALGLGALNEMVEFLATLAHHGAHAGGYWNTGWDLVCNFIGAGAAGLVIARSRASAA
jgi:hypothetical protein